MNGWPLGPDDLVKRAADKFWTAWGVFLLVSFGSFVIWGGTAYVWAALWWYVGGDSYAVWRRWRKDEAGWSLGEWLDAWFDGLKIFRCLGTLVLPAIVWTCLGLEWVVAWGIPALANGALRKIPAGQ